MLAGKIEPNSHSTKTSADESGEIGGKYNKA